MIEDVTLNQKEQKRLMVLNRVLSGHIGAAEAAEVLDLSVRQFRRILAAYREDGAAALAHGNRGRAPIHTLALDLRKRVVELAGTVYAGTNHQHFTDLLAEREDIHLSYSTVKRILVEAGQTSPKTRRGRQHRSRRERSPQEGMLLQIDGSLHDWLEGRGPRLTLLAGIDDATGTVPGALFREQEDAQGYMLLLSQVVSSRGCPLAVYHDRHGIFGRSPTTITLDQHLAGIQHEPTQVERVLQDLGITSIAARSPQAKGRIERLFGTFQDRLVTELRLAGISTIQEANALLSPFLLHFNARFAVPARHEGTAYRPLPAVLLHDQIFCFKYVRTVAADNTIRFGEQRLQLQPCHGRASFARCRVEVQERLDGSLAVFYQSQEILSQEAPADAPVLRAKGGRGTTKEKHVAAAEVEAGDMWAATPRPEAEEETSRPHIPRSRPPAPDHPWRRGYQERQRDREQRTKSLNA